MQTLLPCYCRIKGLTAEDFVRIWDYESEKEVKSKLQMFREKLASVLPQKIPLENVDVFSVMTHYHRRNATTRSP